MSESQVWWSLSVFLLGETSKQAMERSQQAYDLARKISDVEVKCQQLDVRLSQAGLNMELKLTKVYTPILYYTRQYKPIQARTSQLQANISHFTHPNHFSIKRPGSQSFLHSKRRAFGFFRPPRSSRSDSNPSRSDRIRSGRHGKDWQLA